MEREELLRALGRIALSPPNDAVALAMSEEGADISQLDLWGVSEFKRNGKNIELKFADRVKSISLLLEQLGGGEDGMAQLLAALEDDGG